MKSLFARAGAASLALFILLAAPAKAEAPAADPDDVASIDSILTAVYDVISGAPGEARDWDRMRSLFIDGARLIPRSTQNPNGAVVWTVEDYITNAGPNLEKNGFFEKEIGRHVDQYGDIAQVFSSYAATRAADDATPFVRGVNSFQLMKHNDRWWVVTIYWQSEGPDNPIPAELLKK